MTEVRFKVSTARSWFLATVFLATVALLLSAHGAETLSEKSAAERRDRVVSDPWVVYNGFDGPGKGKHVVLVSGDEEYRSEEALPQLGKILAKHHGFKCTVLFAINPEDGAIDPDNTHNIPGLEALRLADLMIIATRFRDLPDEQMKYVAEYLDAGKPVIGMRAAVVAFRLTSPTYERFSCQSRTWKGGFGQQILGQTWISHHGRHGRESTRGLIAPGAENVPIVRGCDDVWGPTDVYTVRSTLPNDSKVLMLGRVLDGMQPTDKPLEGPKNNPMMPVAWTRSYHGINGVVGRVFTTTMGAATDLESEGFRRLLVNATYWCVGLEEKIPGEANVETVGEYKPSPFGFGKYKKGIIPSDHAFGVSAAAQSTPGVAVAAEKEPHSAYAESKRIISRHKTVFTGPSRGTPSKASVDAPLLGNGDVGVCISGPPEKQTFWLAKNDFWRLRSTYRQGWPAPLGVVEVSVPELRGGSYHIEQDLYSAVTRSVFEKDASKVVMTSFILASANVLIVEVALEGEPVKANVQLRVNTGSRSESSSGIDNGLYWGRRSFAKDVDIPTSCACAMRLFSLDKPEFTLEPGRPVTIAVALKSSFETENDLADAKQMVSKLDVTGLKRAHQEWWRNYWAKSYVEINDPVIEKQYYLSLYVMGSCSRNPEFPPGIFGTWVTQDSCSWAGDYHLNYNHMAPFYALYSCNRIEQADPHDTPLLDFIEKGQAYAKEELNCRGVYYPVGIGPKGIETSRDGTYDNRGDSSPGLFCGQKSNASYCLVNIATRWYYTYDRGYAEKLYPFAREVATFWEDYLTWDDSAKRYVIENDAIHENTFGDFNPILSLALVRSSIELAIDMSTALKVDHDRHEKWLHILNNMSAFPTQKHEGREVFRYTERGRAWWNGNTLGIQHIFPAGQIHLDSKPELIRLAKNTIEAMGRWLDRNGSNSFFPAAVRVGYDPNVILQQLDKYCKNARPNGFQKNNPHGIENCSTVPNTVNEMLCMSHGGMLRLFPVWPREKDARFTNIRAWGAFLVSSEIKDGQVQYVRIESERGRVCTVQNPWPGRRVAVFRNGVKTKTVSGTRFALATQVLEEIKLLPQQ